MAYGPDETFGMIATDDDMAGGGHRDHRPTLDGLAPETTYSFVLQGADADGTLYRSEVMEFTTPTAAPAQTPGRNLATDATVVDVSSEFAAAIDSDHSTAWSSDGDGDDAFITSADRSRSSAPASSPGPWVPGQAPRRTHARSRSTPRGGRAVRTLRGRRRTVRSGVHHDRKGRPLVLVSLQ